MIRGFNMKSAIVLGLSVLACGVAPQAQYRPGSSGGSTSGGRPGGFGGSFGAGGGGGFGAGGGGGAAGPGGFGSASDVGGVGGAGGSGSLEETIPGVPGDDYPIFSDVPETSFLCDGQVDGGYYADPEAECQAFHICANDGNGGLTKYSFLCPNGTLFQQQYFVCEWWFNVDCSLAEQFYSLNEEVAAERESNSPSGGGDYSQSGGQAGGRGGQGGSRGSSSSSGSRGSSGARGGAGSRQGSTGGSNVGSQGGRGSSTSSARGTSSRGGPSGSSRGGSNGSSRGNTRGNVSGGRRGGPSASATGSQSSYLAPGGGQGVGGSQSGFGNGGFGGGNGGFGGDFGSGPEVIAADTGYGAPPTGSGAGAGASFGDESDDFPSYNRNTRDLDIEKEFKDEMNMEKTEEEM